MHIHMFDTFDVDRNCITGTFLAVAFLIPLDVCA